MKTTILLFSLCINVFAQFDSLIFYTDLKPDHYNGVFPLGDQNGDGYDDILIYACRDSQVNIFYGGNPMPTEAALKFTKKVKIWLEVFDVNNDGKLDIVLATRERLSLSSPVYINIYHGGEQLDSIPDLVFKQPPGSKGFAYSIRRLRDFDGDGKNELLIEDPFLPYSSKQFGTFYFYRTIGSTLDTIPFKIMVGDSTSGWEHMLSRSLGDINGDGQTDLILSREKPDSVKVEFYIGNAFWNTDTPAVNITVKVSEYIFPVHTMRLIDDINGDGKNDFIMSNYRNIYPYYFGNLILYGGIPFDTIQDVGLNTSDTYIDRAVRPGDVNGDGYNDLLGRAITFFADFAKVYIGGRQMETYPKKTWPGFIMDRLNVAVVGDVDGDNVDDICITKSNPDCDDYLGNVMIYKGDTSVVSGIRDSSPSVPKNFVISEPFPNPFNASSVIKYTLKEKVRMKIKLFDSLGRELVLLLDEEKNAGEYELEIDSNKLALASGVYFVKFEATEKGNSVISESKKLILMK